jgi:hypothetical protein
MWVSRYSLSVMSILRTAGELVEFMKHRKRLWMLPVVTILLVVGGLLVLAEGSALAPFIYSIF